MGPKPGGASNYPVGSSYQQSPAQYLNYDDEQYKGYASSALGKTNTGQCSGHHCRGNVRVHHSAVYQCCHGLGILQTPGTAREGVAMLRAYMLCVVMCVHIVVFLVRE